MNFGPTFELAANVPPPVEDGSAASKSETLAEYLVHRYVQSHGVRGYPVNLGNHGREHVVHLAHAAINRYEGSKRSADAADVINLAQMLCLGLLPEYR